MNLKKNFSLGFIFSFLLVFHNVYPAASTSLKEISLIPKEENTLWYELKDVCPKEEKKFVIVIPSYNNKDLYKKNLDSVFMQVYENYRVIYVDDASTDGTGKLVENYIKENKLEEKTTLIKNEKNLKAMANLYSSIHSCQDDEIVVNLDGDDWLAHEHVLTLLNKVYSNFDVWLTYGQFKWFPSNQMGICKAPSKERIINNNFRMRGVFEEIWRQTWTFSHLITFYAWLFKKIKIEDLKLNGSFLPASYDLAIMYPMLEMAGFKSKFIPDVLYIYNVQTPLNDHKLRPRLQRDIGTMILHKEKYQPLKEAPSHLVKKLPEETKSTPNNF